MLILSSMAKGGEVVVSRGELVEIGGKFRIPDVMEQSGARLVEWERRIRLTILITRMLSQRRRKLSEGSHK